MVAETCSAHGLQLQIALDRQTPDANAVVAHHDNCPVGQVGRDLVEVGEEERGLSLRPARHVTAEQDDARLHCP